jgi:hypothetical protein
MLYRFLNMVSTMSAMIATIMTMDTGRKYWSASEVGAVVGA